MTSKPQPGSNTAVIARNSFWYTLEVSCLFVSTLVTSIVMARVIGPQKLGYFNYIQWLTNMSGLAGSLGIPATTRKYMAEYLGKGQAGIARAIFFATFRFQVAIALGITTVALAVVWLFADPAQRLISAIQVASIFPAMAVFVPAQANTAREDLKSNFSGSMVGGAVYVGSVLLSLALGWGLLGIAIGIFLSRSLELVVRAIPVWRRAKAMPQAELPDEIRRRMFSFSGQSMALMLLNIVVWDRSDIVFLKLFCRDTSQITFYTVAFNLTERALLFPRTFAQAIGATIMAQFGRDRSRLSPIVSAATRYMLMFALPVLLGLASISSPAMRLIYGHQYIPAIPVLAVASVLAIPRAVLLPMQQLFEVHERQGFLIKWGCFCGLLNCALDVLLIPHHAALGAGIANGVAQTVAVFGIAAMAVHIFEFHLDLRAIAKIVFSGAIMVAAVLLTTHHARDPIALALAVPVGIIAFGLALRFARVLQAEDCDRLSQLSHRLPGSMRRIYDLVIAFLAATTAERRASAELSR